MYNAEKYLGACLKSVLGQTFQNFEVIVVDDCSTDNSYEIAQSFIAESNGRLKIYRMNKNSGSPSAPSNRGLALSRGKYIYFMDDDDLIVDYALATLYKHAEESQADVVHMDRKFEFLDKGDQVYPDLSQVRVDVYPINCGDKPTLIQDDQLRRLQKAYTRYYSAPAWHKFVRRDFLIENEIIFPDLRSSSDLGWSFQLVYHAEKVFVIPNPLYIYRLLESSLSHKQRVSEESVNFWTDMFVNGMEFFDDWTKKQAFLAENPQLKFMVFDAISNDYVGNMMRTLAPLSTDDFYRMIETRMAEKFGQNGAFNAFCFASSIVSKFKCNILQRQVKELDANQKKAALTTAAPKISVIIPLHNAEKYISACLTSVLNQTFPNFEVIVVDDCSTDKSYEIAQSFIPNSNGRLKIYRTNKNSGGSGEPSNIGVSLARGKYVYVLDDSDLLINNALEILYNYAEESQADVIHMARGAVFVNGAEKEFPAPEDLRIVNWTPFDSEKPELEPENIGERVQNICRGLMGRTTWQKFVLRDLLIENKIVFPEGVRIAMDTVWAAQTFCCAKKILTIPDALHIYREVAESTSRKKTSPEENAPATMRMTVEILTCMEKFLAGQKFFVENSQYHYAPLNYFERACFGDFAYQTPNVPADHKFFDFIKPEFEKNFGAYGNILAYFCTASNFSRELLELTRKRVLELENQLKQIQGG